jgi:hypothetical protein
MSFSVFFKSSRNSRVIPYDIFQTNYGWPLIAHNFVWNPQKNLTNVIFFKISQWIPCEFHTISKWVFLHMTKIQNKILRIFWKNLAPNQKTSLVGWKAKYRPVAYKMTSNFFWCWIFCWVQICLYISWFNFKYDQQE